MPDRAQDYYRRAFDLLDRQGRGDSLDASLVLSNWGVALFTTGNPLRARGLLERSIAIDRQRSLAGEYAQYTNSNLGAVLRTLGRYAEADAAYDVALSVEPDPLAKVYAVTGKARVAVLQGQLVRAQQLLDEASVTMREHQIDPDTTVALAHTIVQGKVWVGQGRARDAVAAFARVHDAYTKLACCPGPHGLALIERAAAFAADRQFEAAARDAHAGIELAQQAQGQMPLSSLTGQAWLTLADIEQAQGHVSAAHGDYVLAVRNLVETLGEEHPDTVRARKGMSDT
jgi:tetratricopeptide (TPR) repeat protein